jgi:rod shape determining protein RodA
VKKITLDRRLLENFSWPLVLSMLGLIVCGLVNLYSVTLNAPSTGSVSEFGKQAIFCGAGLALAFLAMFFDYRLLRKPAPLLYGFGIALLVLVEFMGITAGGATRWLPLFGVRFQPSEFVKPVLAILVASFFARDDYQKKGLTLTTIIAPTLVTLLPFALILREPDLGTAGLLCLTVLPMFLFLRFSRALLITIVSVTAGALIWVFLLGGLDFLQKKGIIHGYQIDRILTHQKPEEDSNGKGWQILQSKSAIGSGQVLGRGFHDGTQQKYGFLPAPKTDFAFAALAEEWGFVGALVVLSLFYILLRSAIGVARRSKDRFGRYLALGLTSLIFWQMLINVLMVTGLFPVVGIPLPFVSYGGTSLLVTTLAVATINNVGMRRYLFQERPLLENSQAWREGQPTLRVQEKAPLVRRLKPPNPQEPDVFPDYRLPHTKPWLKFMGRGKPEISPPEP